MGRKKLSEAAEALSHKQRLFCEEFIVDLNATRAALRAGYSETSAGETGHEILKNPNASTYVLELQEARSQRTQITADKVLQEIARIGFANMQDFAVWGENGVTLLDSGELSVHDTAAVLEISETRGEKSSTVKIKLHDKLKALELAGKHLGIYTEKFEFTGKNGGAIVLENLNALSDEQLACLVETGIAAQQAIDSGGDSSEGNPSSPESAS